MLKVVVFCDVLYCEIILTNFSQINLLISLNFRGLLNDIAFPAEYDYLLELDVLNESTLRPNKVSICSLLQLFDSHIPQNEFSFLATLADYHE